MVFIPLLAVRSSRWSAPLAAVTLLVVTGCANSYSARGNSAGAGAGTAEVRSRPARPTRAVRAINSLEAPIATALEQLGEEVRAYHAHVTTLSNPFFEGRAPGSHGIEVAADYIEFYFKEFGLEPLFERSIEAADGTEVLEPTFRQTFDVSGETIVDEAMFEWSVGDQRGELTAETDFDPMPFSGNGQATGPVVFVGYAIESGQDDYTSFEDDADLEGKVALVFRFEPMNDEGKSLWAKKGRWTNNAGLVPKIRSLTDRGAVGVILVNPPGVADPRAGKLMSARGSRFGGDGDVPVVMVSTEAAEKIVEAAGQSLMDLRHQADAGSHGAIDLDGLTVATSVEMGRVKIPTDNIAGVLPGKGSLRNEYIVIGGHYDHVGYGDYGTRHPGALHSGADDNASGTSGVLLATQILANAYSEMPDDAEARSIVFIAFTAEELGLLGSKEFVKNPPFALSQIDAMLNMDMIGRLRDGELEVLVSGAGDPFGAVLDGSPTDSGLHITRNTELGGRSDHASFAAEGIPAVAFFSGLHKDYHAPGDVGSKIHHKGAVRIVDFVTAVALDLATRADRITIVTEDDAVAEHKEVERPASPRLASMSVRLGIAPGNYAGQEPGVMIGAVSKGTSASNAGLKKDDRIVRWDGEELLDVRAMMERLMAAKPGDVAELVVVRDGKEIEIPVTLLARGGAK